MLRIARDLLWGDLGPPLLVWGDMCARCSVSVEIYVCVWSSSNLDVVVEIAVERMREDRLFCPVTPLVNGQLNFSVVVAECWATGRHTEQSQ